MFKKKQVSTNSKKLSVSLVEDEDDSLVGRGSGGLRNYPEQPSGDYLTGGESAMQQEKPEGIDEASNKQFLDENTSDGVKLVQFAQPTVQAQDVGHSFFTFKNRNKGVPNVFAVSSHPRGLVIDESRLTIQDVRTADVSGELQEHSNTQMLEEERRILMTT